MKLTTACAFAIILFCSKAFGQLPDMMYAEFSPDGKMILTADFENLKFRLFSAKGDFIGEIQTGLKKTEESKETPVGGIIYVYNPSVAHFSQDGKSVFVLHDNNLVSWNIALKKEIVRLKGIDYADLSYDRQWLVLENGKSTMIYSTNTWKLLKSINVVGPARISPNNKTLAVSTMAEFPAQDLKFFDIATGKAKSFAKLKGLAEYLRYSPDGRYFVFVDDDWTVLRFVDGNSGKALDSLVGSFNTYFSPDGKRVITMSLDDNRDYVEKYAQVWEVDTRLPAFKLEGHTMMLNAVRFSPDGLKIGTSSDDGKTILWDAATGNQLATLIPSAPVAHTQLMSFDLQNKFVITASEDGVFSIWDLYGGWGFSLQGENVIRKN